MNAGVTTDVTTQAQEGYGQTSAGLPNRMRKDLVVILGEVEWLSYQLAFTKSSNVNATAATR